jgi:lysine-specific demethylase 8
LSGGDPEPFTVERIAPPTPDQFRRRYLEPGRPVVIAGLTDDWNVRRNWTFAGLADRHGHRRIPIAETYDGAVEADTRRGIHYAQVSLGDYVRRLASGDHPGLYLTTSIDRFLPELLDELDVPPYCRDARWRRSRLWMSAPGSLAPLHRDIAPNLFVQLIGKKRFWLYHREAWLYPHSPFSAVPNFSRFDPEQADFERFPLARRALRVEVVLEPGEVLFLPSLFWHHVRGLERSLSVNFWWAEGWLGRLARAAEIYSRVRKMA